MSSWRTLAAAAVTLVAALPACAPVRSAADPFAEAGDEGGAPGNARIHRVRLEVVCEQCAVSYSVAGRSTSAGAISSIWRHTLNRYPAFPEAIRLQASGRVSRIRIYVNGDLAASAESTLGADNVVLQAETVIPLPAEPPKPDSLDAEGPDREAVSRRASRSPPGA